MKKILSILCVAALLLSVLPAAFAADGPTEYVAPTFYKNENGPTIGVAYVGVVEQEGLYFRDSNNNGELEPYEDWRLPVEERVADLLPRLTMEQRAGLILNQMAASPSAGTYEQALKEDGTVDLGQLITLTEGDVLSYDNLDANTTGIIIGNENRSGVLRKDTDIKTGALYNNAVSEVAEFGAILKQEVALPYNILSNPMRSGYPAAGGFAAAAIGDGNFDIILRYAQLDRIVWVAKGVDEMYGPQIDLITDPRWNRNTETFTEIPEINEGIATALVTGYQNGTDGIQDGDVALIMKHFPGDGAAENGFESHNKVGEWRIYATEGSLEKYQLTGFQAAIDAGLQGIMPGYSRPAADARSAKQSYRGVELEFEEIGNAYNKGIIGTLLYDIMGFKGFINTDSGIISGQYFGVPEETSIAQRYAMIINAGSDTGANGMDFAAVREAIDTGLVEEEALNRATSHRLTALISMGRLDNPYRDPEESQAAYDAIADEVTALKAELNHKSVVLLKNHENALPLTDTAKKVYVQAFTNGGNAQGSSGGASVEDIADTWKQLFAEAGYTVVEEPDEADVAFLSVKPGGVTNSGTYMNVIDLVEDLEVEERLGGKLGQDKTGETISHTTLEGVKDIKKIANKVHDNGGVVIASIDLSSPWILTNLEPYCDALFGQFSTSNAAQFDVITGAYAPTGKLPLTLVSSNDVIAVNEVEIDGVIREICVSPNDVPGYDKDQYIDPEILDNVPGGSYAYFDADGNYYRSGFGLSY